MPEPGLLGWRAIDDLARLVGHYCWTEHRVFEVAGALTAAPVEDGAGAEATVWCAAVSRRHGEVARAWADRLPVRAGVDSAGFVTAPSDALAEALEGVEALADSVTGAGALVRGVLPGLERVYARHLGCASAVTEGPVMEVLTAACRVLAGERAAGESLLRGMQYDAHPEARVRTTFEQAFEEMGVLPAVRPS